jgi:tetrapyrrole methylase family protein/MazG family protein
MNVPQSRPVSDQPYPPGLPAIFEVVRRLRAPDGCPWDREQTHQSLRQYLLEETYELLEAIDLDDQQRLLEELGDVLLQVAMHAEIADQEGRFDAGQVSEKAAAKMVARHPHVFGDVEAKDADQVLRNWEKQKAAEAANAGQKDESVLDRVPHTLPALAWALQLQKRAARVGFETPLEGAGDRLTEDELGRRLFDLVNLARRNRLNPEDALRIAGQRFKNRFNAMESELRSRGSDLREMSEAERAELWQAAAGQHPVASPPAPGKSSETSLL